MTAARPVPRLAAGVRVVRRGQHHLQVGLYDDRRALLPRTAPVQVVLDCLLQQRPPPEGTDTVMVLGVLASHGLLARDPAPVRPRRVAVLGCPDPLPAGLDLLPGLLARAGLRATTVPGDADLALVTCVGELDRDRLDPLVRSRTTHLVVRLVDGGAVVGPFVVPGVTACLRCVDAHHADLDPDHVTVTARYVRATERPRADGVEDVPDPTLGALALSWAVRDLVALCAGREPSTWSRTLAWGPDVHERREDRWLRHPRCGCSWLAAEIGRGNPSGADRPEQQSFARVAD